MAVNEPAGATGRPATRPAGEAGPRGRIAAGALKWVIAGVLAAACTVGFLTVHACKPTAGGLPPAIAAKPGAAAGFNVVLITLDTLRADYVGCYGASPSLVATPSLDALAAGGVRFTEAATTVPLTLPAHATIFTGNYPPRHGVRNNGTSRLPASATTLAERLRDAGYRTAAFVSSFILDARFGTDQGFELYSGVSREGRSGGEFDHDRPERPGNVVTDEALAWLGSRSPRETAPFFLWLHLYDPHLPYAAPEPYRSRYPASPYAAEVAFTDHQVGRLVARLQDQGLLDRTLVAVAGDHGEGLNDHGEDSHGLLLYESTVAVPLLLHSSTVLPRGKVVDDRVVSLADIAPTLVDLLGLPQGACDGLSLLQPGAPPDRAVYLETFLPRLQRGWSELRGLRRRRDKYIEAPAPEYYDLASDRGEQRNLFGASREAEKLRKELADYLATFPGEKDAPLAALQPDPETVRKLTALGYLGGKPPPPSGPPSDPKEVIAHWSRTRDLAQEAADRGRLVEAIGLFQGYLAEFPTDGDSWKAVALLQEQAGLRDDALKSWLKVVELQPGEADSWVNLAKIQYSLGDRRAVAVTLERAERLESDHGALLLIRAMLMRDEGRPEEALRLCRAARERDPARYSQASWIIEALLLEEVGRTAQARSAYRQVLQIDPGNPTAAQALERLKR